LHAFSSYCMRHLSRESELVENTTLMTSRVLSSRVTSDHTTPIFWMWSFKFNKPMKCVIAFSVPLILFVTHLSFSTQVISHTKMFVLCMHEADCSFDKNDIFVPQSDLRSHAAPVHDTPSPVVSLQRRQQMSDR